VKNRIELEKPEKNQDGIGHRKHQRIMKIALASDHREFSYKEKLIPELRKKEFDVLGLGVFSASPADYPDVAEKMMVVKIPAS
jgi:hypothetical protein